MMSKRQLEFPLLIFSDAFHSSLSQLSQYSQYEFYFSPLLPQKTPIFTVIPSEFGRSHPYPLGPLGRTCNVELNRKKSHKKLFLRLKSRRKETFIK